MTMFGWFARTAASTIVSLIAVAASAADYPLPKEGDWVARDFRFHTGEIVPQLRLHYTTVGEPSGEPVLVLHGTAGSGAGMLTSAFAGELFGPGQPLDARKYFIILPDAIGAGQSSKPSDGLRTKFPQYNYEDMIAAQYLLVTKGFGSATCALSSATRWAACRPGSGARPTLSLWMRWCRWPHSRAKWPAATGCCAAC